MPKKWAKNVFVFDFFWIWSIAKVHIICYIPVQILHLGKTSFLAYGPKFSWLIKLQDFKSTISSKLNDEIVWFFACWYKVMNYENFTEIFLGGHSLKRIWLLWSHDYIVSCISWTNWLNKLFCVLIQTQES